MLRALRISDEDEANASAYDAAAGAVAAERRIAGTLRPAAWDSDLNLWYWCRKPVNEPTPVSDRTSVPTLVPVQMAAEPPAFIEIVMPGGERLRIRGDVSAPLLQAAITAL